jgi:hypothetical protein
VLMEIANLHLAGLPGKYFERRRGCRHREHLFRRVAWRLQALAEGDVPNFSAQEKLPTCALQNDPGNLN